MSTVASQEWRDCHLGDIGQILIGLTYSPSQVSASGTLVLRSSNIQNGQLALDDTVRVIADIPDQIRVRVSDVLICVRNGSRALIGKSLCLDERVEGETFGAFMAIFRSAHNDYLRFFFQSEEFKRQVDEHLGATINQITNRSLRGFEVHLPPPEERRLIAEVLADSEELIWSIERLISKKRWIRQGIVQQLVTGKTRLKGFDSDWTTYTLRSIGRTYGGLTGKSAEDFGCGDGRFVTFMDVMANLRIDGSRLAPVRTSSADKQNVVRNGDLLLNGSSETPDELAMAAVAVGVPPGTFLNSFCFGFRLNGDVGVDSEFLACLLRADVGRRLLASAAQGAIRYNLSKRQFLSLQARLPVPEEQRAIAAVIQECDEEISLLEARLNKARAIKQGMMQELLTGRTRLAARGALA